MFQQRLRNGLGSTVNIAGIPLFAMLNKLYGRHVCSALIMLRSLNAVILTLEPVDPLMCAPLLSNCLKHKTVKKIKALLKPLS